MSIQITEVKALMTQFDKSSLREFSYATSEFNLSFSKNTGNQSQPVVETILPEKAIDSAEEMIEAASCTASEPVVAAEGEIITSPLVGVAYLKPAPDKSDFIAVGDQVTKGQTLLIIEAMKVMNEIPAPKTGIITEILVAPEEMVEYGEELVRIK